MRILSVQLPWSVFFDSVRDTTVNATTSFLSLVAEIIFIFLIVYLTGSSSKFILHQFEGLHNLWKTSCSFCHLYSVSSFLLFPHNKRFYYDFSFIIEEPFKCYFTKKISHTRKKQFVNKSFSS